MSNQNFENPTLPAAPPEPSAKKPFPVLGLLAIISVVLSVIVVVGGIVLQPKSSTTSKTTPEAAADSSDPLADLGKPDSAPQEAEAPTSADLEVVDAPEELTNALPEKLRPANHCFLSETYMLALSESQKIVTCGVNASENSVSIVYYYDTPEQVAALREPAVSPFTELQLKLKSTEGHDIRVIGSPGIWYITDFQPGDKALQYSMLGGNEEDVEEFLIAYDLAK